jgi:type IV pilus assembly protein PilO
MTASGDFIPSGNGDNPNVPTVFGVRMTPTVVAVLLALAGLGVAVYLLMYLVQPSWQRNQELRQEVATKEAQLVDQTEIQRRIAEARADLAEAEQLQADVLALFASQESLDTLLLDINERVQAVNAGIQDEDRRATLSKFELDPQASGLVVDSSLGSEVNNRLERRVYNVEMRGNFAQTESIIRNIERLQPLLIVRDLRSELDSTTQAIVLNNQGRLTPTGQPETRITTAFKLIALVPADETSPAPAAGAPVTSPTTAPPAASPAASPTIAPAASPPAAASPAAPAASPTVAPPAAASPAAPTPAAGAPAASPPAASPAAPAPAQ